MYRWHLSMHDNAETADGTVRAVTLEEATRLALVDSQIDEQPDHREPGLVTWASAAGVTTLVITPETAG